MSLRLPHSTLGVSALTALSGAFTQSIIPAFTLNDLIWNTNRYTKIYSKTDKSINPYSVTPLSTYGIPSLTATKTGTITSYLNGYIDHMVSLWVQVNNETKDTTQYGTIPSCSVACRIYEPDAGQHWKANTGTFNVNQGDILTFFIGSGIQAPSAGYFYKQLQISVNSPSVTQWLTLSAPVYFSYYGGQDYDIQQNYLNLSDFRDAMNYDEQISINTSLVTTNLAPINVYYYYTANNSIVKYPNKVYPLSSVILQTRHVDLSGYYVSLNANIINNNSVNVLYQTNGEIYNTLPICRILNTNKTALSTVFSNLSSYANFYIEAKNNPQKINLQINNNISSLKFISSQLH